MPKTKKVKVILLENVPGLGLSFEIKDVSLGYYKNFLLPNNLAIILDEKHQRQLEELKRQIQNKKAKELKDRQLIFEKIKDLVLVFRLKAGAKGEIYGSVRKKQILDQLKAKGIIFQPNWLKLEQPIKELGEHNLPVHLGENLETTLKILIEPE